MTYDDDEMKRMENMFNVHKVQNGKKNINEILDEPSILTHDDNSFFLKNIVCYNSLGEVTEAYERLIVDKHTYFGNEIKHVSFDIDHAIEFFDQMDMFVPSAALTSNVLNLFCDQLTVFNLKMNDRPLYDAIFDHVDDYFSTTDTKGMYLQNTLVDYQNQEIIHYPNSQDMTDSDFEFNMNLDRKVIGFQKFDEEELSMHKTCEDPLREEFLQNFMGMQNPMKLAEVIDDVIGNFPENRYIRTIAGIKDDSGIGFIGSDGIRKYIMTANPATIAMRGYRAQ